MIRRFPVKHLGLLIRRPFHDIQFSSNDVNSESAISVLCKHLNLSETKAKYITLKYPVINKLNELKLKCIIDGLHDLGYSKEVLMEEPSLFGILPITLKLRYQVLKECGFIEITPRHLISYLSIMKQKTIRELKETREILDTVNVENRLASHMTQWPTSLTTLINDDISTFTLYSLRLKIIQRYLELVLDLSNEEFQRGLQTYPTIKHRPLTFINETLTILQSQIMMPTHKIKANLYLVHVDPENLKHIIYNFRSIGGIDIKEVIRMYPKLAVKNYTTLIEIRKILQEYSISNEAQRRCFEVYTLGPRTIRERLDNAKTIPEFQTFFNHPRFLKMIYYNNTAIKRLTTLYSNNKKCMSLNVLSGSSAHYEIFEKAPGDRLGKGKDVVFCISQCLGKSYSVNDIRHVIKKHPFWINIPLVQIKYVHQQLSTEFTPQDIYQNCPILLYPWNKIRELLQLFTEKQKRTNFSIAEQLDPNKLNNSQKLSLVLYLLEKNHYFTGNGVWSEEKNRNIDTVNIQNVKTGVL